MLESQLHAESRFVTLTYDEESYPRDGCVSVREVQLFLKRLRSNVDPHKIRYFVVGEYGDGTFRAHYHAALFGTGDEEAIRNAWRKGWVHIGVLSPASARYIADYTLKRMTNEKDPRLGGRTPEFARMSLRPGIGGYALGEVAKAVTSASGARYVASEGDVPKGVRVDGKVWPLGRYLTGRLREFSGMDKGMPAAAAAVVAERARDRIVEFGRDALEGKRKMDQRRAQGRVKLQRAKRML